MVCFLSSGRAVALEYADQKFRTTGGAIFRPPGAARRRAENGAEKNSNLVSETGRTLTAGALCGPAAGGKAAAVVGFEDGGFEIVEFAAGRAADPKTAEELVGAAGVRVVASASVRPPVLGVAALGAALTQGLAAHVRAVLRRCVLVLDGAGALALFAGRDSLCRYASGAGVVAFAVSGSFVFCLVGGRRVGVFPLFSGAPVVSEVAGAALAPGVSFDRLEVAGFDGVRAVVCVRAEASAVFQLVEVVVGAGVGESVEDVGRRLFWAVQGDE